jgi:DNA-binding PadR family transcriptional regulator
MTRLFRRGELKSALLDALDESGPANGYTIMQMLSERIGESWQPSPGAVYPALLALEDTGLVRGNEQGASREYELTAAGRRAANGLRGTLDAVAERARTSPRAPSTVGMVVDDFAARFPGRARVIDDELERAVAAVLEGSRTTIERLIGKEK